MANGFSHFKPGMLVLFVLAMCYRAGAQAPPPSQLSLGHPTPNETASEAAEFGGVPSSVEGGLVEAALFYIFGGSFLVSALGVCISKSIVRMAIWLFFTLGAAAVLYLLLGAFFLGAIQLIVYAGGTLILLVFGVMLTSKSPWVRFDSRPIEFVAAGVVAVVLFLALTAVLVNTTWSTQATVSQGATVAAFGKELLTTYLVPFEVASVVLLVVMIGAAYLARQEK